MSETRISPPALKFPPQPANAPQTLCFQAISGFSGILQHSQIPSPGGIVYRREAVAGPDGAVAFRVPYATVPDAFYRITLASPGAGERRVTVSEAEVFAGATVFF